MLNVKNLKSQMSSDEVIEILSSLGAECRKTSTNELIFTSICHHRDDASKHKAKLYYYIDTQSFYCFSCNWTGDIIALVQLINHYTFTEAIQFICDILHLNTGYLAINTSYKKYDWRKDFLKYTQKDYRPECELTVYDDRILDFFEPKYPLSWIEEGISVETMKKYEIGWYNGVQMITIPVRDECNNLIGIHGRNLNPRLIERGLKYCPVKMLDKTEYKFPSSMVLFGLNYAKQNIIDSKEVILVEAPKSVMQLDSILPKNNSIALFGTNCSKYNRDYLLSLGIQRVIIALDRQYNELYDENGNYTDEFIKYKKTVEKICKLFIGYVDVYIIYDKAHLLDYKDSPSDKGKEIWDILYDEREVVK